MTIGWRPAASQNGVRLLQSAVSSHVRQIGGSNKACIAGTPIVTTDLNVGVPTHSYGFRAMSRSAHQAELPISFRSVSVAPTGERFTVVVAS